MSPITLVIPTLDSAGFIADTVAHYDALLRRGLLEAVVIVDDCSTDATWEVMCREKAVFSSSILLVRMVARYGQLTAYHAGVDLATTDTILHCDDDVLLSEADLTALVEVYEQRQPVLLYGLASGKKDHPLGRSTFLWLVKTFVFYRLPDQEFSSLVIYSRERAQAVFRRAWGYTGNLFTPWIFHSHELYHTYLGAGSRILPHPSRYSLAGYIHHQRFLFMMLARLSSVLLVVAMVFCLIIGLRQAWTYWSLVAGLMLFCLSAAWLSVRSRLRYRVAEIR